MSQAIRKVAVAGASGSLGQYIVKALVASGAFHVTVLSRDVSAIPRIEGVFMKNVDYSSIRSLTEAVSGQDAVVDSTFSETDLEAPRHLIEACVAAGVYRYIPPEFGADPHNQDVQALPFFQRKAETMKFLLEKIEGTGLTWTAIACGPFFDPPLKDGSLGIDVRKRKGTIFGDGKHILPWSTLDSVGKATAQTLLQPAETANRVVYISNVNISQLGILDLAKEELGVQGWQIETEDIQEAYRKAREKLCQGELDPWVSFTLLKYSLTSGTYTYTWKQDDNALLGVEQFRDNDVKAVIEKVANSPS